LRLWLSTILVVSLVGCSSDPGDGVTTSVISVGQSWAESQDVARRAGYELHDAGQLQMYPPIDGFYLNLSGDRAVLVTHDPQTHTACRLELWQNWSKGKRSRSATSIQSYDLAQ